MPDELMKLIEMMASEDNEAFSDDSDSWKAYRIAEELNDPELIPLLLHFVASESPQDDFKKMAFTILRYVLKNSGSIKGMDHLIGLLSSLQKNETLLVEALHTLTAMKGFLPGEQASSILEFVDDDRQAVRNWAIRSLNKFEGNVGQIESTLIYVLEQYYDRYDLRYALEVLESIGTRTALPSLEALLEMDESWKDEVLPDAKYTIEAITKRSD